MSLCCTGEVSVGTAVKQDWVHCPHPVMWTIWSLGVRMLLLSVSSNIIRNVDMQLEQPVDRLRVGRRDTKGVQY
jgi:hypothetical protein